jgi:hypothetical protein
VTPAAAQDSLPAHVERVGTLRHRRLVESSGVAVSRTHPGVLWTHNDSGDSATVYAINLAGDLLVTYRVLGAMAFDWEDIDVATCPGNQAAQCLYIADTGDNSERRKAPTIYVVREPHPPTGGVKRDTMYTQRAHGTRVIYPDGPRDVEALAVDPRGNALLITKGRVGIVEVYRLPRSALTRDSARAVLADTLPMIPQGTLGRFVTGAAFSPSGERLVVRTYTELYFFRYSRTGRLVPEGPPCWLGAVEPQGEAVDFLDEHSLVLTSESITGQIGPVLRVRCGKPGRSP